jgi:hypothetical protein
MPTTNTTAGTRRKRPSAFAANSSRVSRPDDASLLPISSEIPKSVWDHIEKARGECRPLAPRSAMIRQILVDWSEANKSSR